MSKDPSKICPNCHKKDVTSFSTCRFCSTKYDAKIARNKININERTIFIISIATLLIAAIVYYGRVFKSIRSQRLASISSEIKATNRPRLIEFYATWCGACKAYEPVLQQCQNKYASEIDFQRLNVDDPQNSKLRRMFEITSIPKTFLFNRKGEEVAEIGGYVASAELDKYLQNPELVK